MPGIFLTKNTEYIYSIYSALKRTFEQYYKILYYKEYRNCICKLYLNKLYRFR